MTKPRKSAARPSKKKSLAYLRPNWSTIVDHMVKTRQDVLLKLVRSGGDVGLYKALRRAGYWAHTHRISENEVVYRLSDKPPLEHESDLLTPKNPLPEEYAPEVPKK